MNVDFSSYFLVQVVLPMIQTVIVYAISADPNRISANVPKALPYQVSKICGNLLDNCLDDLNSKRRCGIAYHVHSYILSVDYEFA